MPVVAGGWIVLFVVGFFTAGFSKTHIAKVAIRQVRRLFGKYRSVLVLAFSGVAAANLGGGAQTIDSIFHTNEKNAAEDLVGEELDALVKVLQDVPVRVDSEIYPWIISPVNTIFLLPLEFYVFAEFAV